MENNKDKIMRKPEVSAGGCRINRSLKWVEIGGWDKETTE
jgi:hypothetical protein